MPAHASELDAYLGNVTKRLAALSGLELVGVYVGGSYALGGYEPGRSDIDVAAVVRGPATADTKHAIVQAIRHETLPCPARGLEFVLYPLETVRTATAESGFELNLNTGREMQFRLDLGPTGSDEHWFAIDRSILGRHGVTLAGEPAAELFAPIPRAMLLPLIIESLRWHAVAGARGDDAVLNACRSLRFALEDVWSTKVAAGEWALRRLDDDPLVLAALAARADSANLDRIAVRRFVAAVTSELEMVAQREISAAEVSERATSRSTRLGEPNSQYHRRPSMATAETAVLVRLAYVHARGPDQAPPGSEVRRVRR